MEDDLEYHIWIRMAGAAGGKHIRGVNFREIARLFADTGIICNPLGDGLAFGLGCVLFEECNPTLVELIRELTSTGLCEIICIAMSNQLDPQHAIDLMCAGASDVLTWNKESIPLCIHNKLVRIMHVERLLHSSFVQTNLIGHSAQWKSTLKKIVEVAYFSTASVLITGETGTGKEVIARMIHSLDTRPKKRQLVTVDCTTLTSELAASELFGHERGSFTSAVSEREGALSLAAGGTLFLDEIGELPASIQAALLRATQEQTYKRVGSNVWQHSEFRLVCATNRDLHSEVEAGSFRKDLYYRIATWHFAVPPLSERREDIVPLAKHFLGLIRPDVSPEINTALARYLQQRSYPGNIRDLRQLIARMAYVHIGSGPLTLGDLPIEERFGQTTSGNGGQSKQMLEANVRSALLAGMTMKEITKVATDASVLAALECEAGNVHRAALRLGITDRALQLRLVELRKVVEKRLEAADEGTGNEE